MYTLNIGTSKETLPYKAVQTANIHLSPMCQKSFVLVLAHSSARPSVLFISYIMKVYNGYIHGLINSLCVYLCQFYLKDLSFMNRL